MITVTYTQAVFLSPCCNENSQDDIYFVPLSIQFLQLQSASDPRANILVPHGVCPLPPLSSADTLRSRLLPTSALTDSLFSSFPHPRVNVDPGHTFLDIKEQKRLRNLFSLSFPYDLGVTSLPPSLPLSLIRT